MPIDFKTKRKRQEEQRESQNTKCTTLREEEINDIHTDNKETPPVIKKKNIYV